jgi:hypothetical protein
LLTVCRTDQRDHGWDDSNTRIQAISLIGYLGANVRVMLLVTPPSSIYIVGLVQTDYPPPGTAIVTLRQDSTVQSIADAGSGSFITWDTAEYMPFGGWTSGTDFTLPFDGQYLCICRWFLRPTPPAVAPGSLTRTTPPAVLAPLVASQSRPLPLVPVK